MSDKFEVLNALQLWDFEIVSFGGAGGSYDALVVHGSRDLSYYRNAAITFIDVTYIECPVRFSHARFRQVTDDEREALRSRVELDGTPFCVVADDGDASQREYYIVARDVSIDVRTVHWSENVGG
jgi:hypothetical protein